MPLRTVVSSAEKASKAIISASPFTILSRTLLQSSFMLSILEEVICSSLSSMTALRPHFTNLLAIIAGRQRHRNVI